MFVVRHKPTGLFFKKHNWRNRSQPFLVEMSKARIYRTKGSAKISVGNWVYLTEAERKGRNFGYYRLDENIWEVMEISLQVKGKK